MMTTPAIGHALAMLEGAACTTLRESGQHPDPISDIELCEAIRSSRRPTRSQIESLRRRIRYHHAHHPEDKDTRNMLVLILQTAGKLYRGR